MSTEQPKAEGESGAGEPENATRKDQQSPFAQIVLGLFFAGLFVWQSLAALASGTVHLRRSTIHSADKPGQFALHVLLGFVAAAWMIYLAVTAKKGEEG